MSHDLSSSVREWCLSPEISAKAVLVTVFGDSVVPNSQSVWLSDLMALTSSFGFSQRLVRTSMYRLTADNWVTSERIGRRSRYTLTSLALSESSDAERRIYHDNETPWDGSWTLVFLDGPAIAEAQRKAIAKRLRWHGFIALGRGNLASPSATPKTVVDMCSVVAPDVRVPVARARFQDLDRLVANGFFDEALQTEQTAELFQTFWDRYSPVSHHALSDLEPIDALALRTMLVHDFRRIRLRAPDTPRALLPREWIGAACFDLAGEIYHRLGPNADIAIHAVLGLDKKALGFERFPLSQRGDAARFSDRRTPPGASPGTR